MERSNDLGGVRLYKTLQIEKPLQISLQSEQMKRSPLKPTELRLKPILGGICGSDVSVFKGRLSHAKYPVIPGHEVIAEVLEAGSACNKTVGSKVVIIPNTFCNTCENCLKERRNICLHKKSLGVNIDGVFSTDFVIDEKFTLEIPSSLQLERSTLTEPFAVIVHAMKKLKAIENKKMAIIGCGTEGMLATSYAHYFKANVTVIDIQQEKLHFIKQHLPAVQTFLPDQITTEKFDIVMECAGARSSVEQAFQLVKSGGEVVLIGFTEEATLPVTQIVRNEVTIMGSIIYDFPVDFEKSMELLTNDAFPVDHIISKVYELERYNEAYEDACSGKYGKILFDFRSHNSE